MKLSLDWLSDYIDLSGLSPQEIAEKLTMNAFEVEDIHEFGPNLQGPIVVGEIVDIQAHPDPKVNKMRVTKTIVEDGKPPLQIVCGATNIQVGQRIPVALPGSLVVNRHDGSAFPIIKADKRGVESNGMLCSAAEIGIADHEIDGILVLDPTLANKLGANIIDLLYLKKDYVLTVASRSNRGDAVSVRGLAREISALFNRPLKEPNWQLEETASKTTYSFAVKIDDINDCEYFSIRSISNIQVKDSPPFITRRLAAVGSRSINNLVDITNYVMHEWGQPMHAYDAKAVKDGLFHVRRGKQSEKYITLDGKERTLNPEMLIISDTEKAIGMPIMGGANSEISNTTVDIALEAASFLPAVVRRTSRLLGLSSESAIRFERGVDAASTKQASDFAAYLISKYCAGGTPVKIGEYVAGGKTDFPPKHVALRTAEVKRHLNLDLSADELIKLLAKLEIKAVEKESKADKLVFAIPSFRQNDLTREIDLVEEVARLYGYNNIKDESPAFFALAKMPDNIHTSIRSALIAQGLCEAYITSLIPDESTSNGNNEHTGIYSACHNKERAITVLNPLSPEHQVLRQSLLPGLLNAAKYNRDRGQENIWLFEIGFTYLKNSVKQNSDTPAEEKSKLAGVVCGTHQLSIWLDGKSGDKSSQQLDFYAVKGILENLFVSVHINDTNIVYSPESKPLPLLHPGKAAKLSYKDSQSSAIELGWLGQLHPAYAKSLDLDSETYLFELDIEILKNLRQQPTFTFIPTLPPITRDLTVDLPANTQNITIVNCIQEAAKNLRALELVSIYALNSDSTSYSYRLTFQSEAETLKSEEIEEQLNQIRKNLKEKVNASFRT